MHRFVAERTGPDTARLPEGEARHALTVLRLSAGDQVQLILEETLFSAVITSVSDGVQARLVSALPSPEPSVRVTLLQGLPKADKMDWIVQKCTEAGVFSIVPVQMPRCVAKTDAKDGARKAERWRRIALEAAKQSGRTHVPDVSAPLSAAQAAVSLPRDALKLVPWEEEKAVPLSRALMEHPDSRNICLIIGPEGGMGEDEIAAWKNMGALPVTLGPRIFRTETAALAAVLLTLNAFHEYD